MNSELIYYPNPDMWEEAKESTEDCPKCGSMLFSIEMGNDPDNFENYLICKKCGYEEKE